MTFVALAAGYATRLRPLTDSFPKPLLPVAGRPILDWLLDDLRALNCIDRYVMVSNHRYIEQFEQWRAADVELVDDGTEANEGRLGAVRDLQLALTARGISGDVLVAAADNILDFSLGRFIDYFREKGASCVMRYREADERRVARSCAIELGEGDRALSMEEKPAQPKSHWCCPPFYLYTGADAALVGQALKEGINPDSPGRFAAWLAARRPVYAMEMPGSRFDIGDAAGYEAVKRHFEG